MSHTSRLREDFGDSWDMGKCKILFNLIWTVFIL